MKLISVFTLFIFVMIDHIDGQIESTNSIKTEFGFGYTQANKTDVFGFIYSFGYQKSIYKDRIRINPNINFGQYNTFFIYDGREVYLNSNSFQLNGEFNLIKKGIFSFFIVAGGYVNLFYGYKAEGYNENNNEFIEPEEINEFHTGINIGYGLRLSSLKNRVAVEIMPVNSMIGTNNHKELYLKAGLSIKL